MLTPKFMKSIPNKLIDIMEDLEIIMLLDVARRLKEVSKGESEVEKAIKALQQQTNRSYLKKITEHIAQGHTTLKETLDYASEQSYSEDAKAYLIGNKELLNYLDNKKILQMVEIVEKDALSSFKNISGTLALDGKPLEQFYYSELGDAYAEIISGVMTPEESIRKVVRNVSDRGLQTIDFESGRRYEIESWTRTLVNSTVNRLAGEMSIQNALDMEVDIMEITAHSGARPSHAEWQGQLMSLSGQAGYLSQDDVGLGRADGLLGANCRHHMNPYFEGLSSRAWSDKEIKELDNPPFEYQGKEYTHYDATQRQRQLERSVRKTKRRVIMYKESGLDEDLFNETIVLNSKIKEYKKFSNAAKLKQQTSRFWVYEH